ncbi:hypothetical protein VTJ04DRAFT_9111 [Mycothermus thermophilus]|uniref:uncharacterized protein n=1 Tax=Humicola insolens TaxID=85995 RepID=UPI0037438D89
MTQDPVLMIPNGSSPAADVPSSPPSVTTTVTEKPYHAKRPHRKSRTGCTNCKRRKVKCDEGRPSCRTCTARREVCVYQTLEKRRSPSSSPGISSASVVASRPAGTGSVPNQPLFIAAGRDALDMRLLWFYTTATYASFSTGPLPERSVDVILKVNVVQHAFEHEFLMNCILGLSAMHANHLGVRSIGVSHAHEMLFRSRAFEAYRKAVAAADPATFPALLATSLLMCGLSTHMFRGEDARPLAILDWIVLWCGIGEIIRITKLPTASRPGIGALFWRPPVDYEASAQHIPSTLLFMLTTIKPTDPEYPLVQHYHTTLRLLGSLYRELATAGLTARLLLRVVTFPTFLPKEVVDAARARKPRALVIIAHYLVWAKMRIFPCWWMEGIAEFEIPNICAAIPPDLHLFLRVPLAALSIHNDKELARLLLEDPTWEPPSPPTPPTPCSPASTVEKELTIRAVRAEDVLKSDVEEIRQNQIRIDLCV